MKKVAFVYSSSESLGVEYLVSYLRAKGHEAALFYDPQLCQDDYVLGAKSNFAGLVRIPLKVASHSGQSSHPPCMV